MIGGGLDAAADLIERTRAVYGDDPAALEFLDSIDTRLQEPLRIAIAGIVKAGKSTLLNALIGERIAPTDAAECTRTVMWYRYGRTPKLTLRLQSGETVGMPVKRSGGDLQIDLGDYTAEGIEWIAIEWPSEHLRRTILIDTPGIASLSSNTSEQSTQFLTPGTSPTEADAIIYMLRHLHASDLHFLEAFRDTAAGQSHTVNALALLSRADEVGSGRIDSLISAARIADRYRNDGELRALTLDVIPVAGLLAEGARTLNEREFSALRTIAQLDRGVRDRLLLSVDRFARRTDDVALSVDERRGLLDRFGIFGVRLAAGQIRAGARDSSDLSERLVQQSGLIELQRFINDQFRSRTVALKTRGALQGIEYLIRDKPVANSGAILGGIERVMMNSHELRELSLLAQARTSVLSLGEQDRADAERIVGGSGTVALRRLGLPEDASDAEISARAGELLARWHGVARSPLTDRATAELSGIVVRSIEGALAELLPFSGSDAPTRDIPVITPPRTRKEAAAQQDATRIQSEDQTRAATEDEAEDAASGGLAATDVLSPSAPVESRR